MTITDGPKVPGKFKKINNRQGAKNLNITDRYTMYI